MQNRERWSAAAPTMSGYPTSIPAYLVLDVDAAPWVLPASVAVPGLRVSQRDVGPHHGEGHPDIIITIIIIIIIFIIIFIILTSPSSSGARCPAR